VYCKCPLSSRSYVELDREIFYRLTEGQTESNKRQSPEGLVADYFVEWHGASVRSVKTGFKTAVTLARLSGK